MKLNHMHLKTTDTSATCKFYEEYFGFRFAFAHGSAHFLVNDNGFLMTVDQYGKDEKPATFPSWFHFGFCQDNPEIVERMYERLRKSGAKFAMELSGEDGEWKSFNVLDPGGFKVEVSWHKEDCEKAPELVGSRAAAKR